jgi:ATP-dependent DNA helicase PIF1
MSKKLFNLLDEIGRRIRKKYDLPFGGIQVIFSGDFYQLPPVPNSYRSGGGGGGDDDEEDDANDASAFCFESDKWNSTFNCTIQLKTIFRQTDLDYCKILNQIRVGKLYKSSLDKLTPHIGKKNENSFKPTKLFPRKKDVEIINTLEYDALKEEEEHIFKLTKVNLDKLTTLSNYERKQDMFISDAQKEMELNSLMNNVMVDKELRLKKGAQVMCVVNLDLDNDVPNPIVNGSQGIIVDFVGSGEVKLPVVQFNNGSRRIIGYHIWQSENIKSIAITQIPLIYAWGITIHKAQGASLDIAEIDAGSNIFECGQTYVALSRIKSLEGLYLTAFDPNKIKVNKKVQEFYAGLDKQ